jgi:CxxC motif-containing protein (DUF1111 family)
MPSLTLNALYQHTGTSLLVAGFFAFSTSLMAQAPNTDKDAFQRPFKNLSAEQKFNHSLGRSLFEKFWVASPSSTTASDGLGPLYNARSCHSCHLNNAKGHAPAHLQSAVSVPSFFVRLKRWPRPDGFDPKKAVTGDPIYGTQLQTLSTTQLPPEANLVVRYDYQTLRFSDQTPIQLRKPDYRLSQLGYGAFDNNTLLSGRVSPALMGVGLIDALDDKTIESHADENDLNQDGISGRTNQVWDKINQRWRLGRFGWKATVATLSEQNQSAFNGDLGLSTPLVTSAYGDCTEAQIDCLSLANGNSQHLDNLEVSKQMMSLVNQFSALSAPSKIRNLANEQFMQGKAVFDQLNCASCHIPKLKTGLATEYKVLSNQTFFPFSDFLLHDMGPGLADTGNEFNADGQEWRTTPLWGNSLNKSTSGRQSYLHDGRARNLIEAIAWHGGEAKPSQKAFLNLTEKQRNDLLYFLESL